MLNEFSRYIYENKLIKSGDRILMAVSGGIDSMVMAHLFQQLDNETGIAHCNFSLRAEESDKDEELVRQYSLRNNIPFYIKRFDTVAYSKDNTLSIQMAARDLRYKWFEEIMDEHNYDLLAVAHNLNDNIETLLINLTRGTGIAGLAGMRPKTNRIIRPLLFATRQDIVTYCSGNQIIYREDRSNEDTKYTRNKIRHKIIPVLKEINPSIETTLNDTAERFFGISEVVTAFISGLRDRISEEKGDDIYFNVELLKHHIQNKTIIYELFRPYGISNVMLNDLVRIIKGKTGSQTYTSSHRIVKNRKEIIVTLINNSGELYYRINNIEELSTVPGILSAELTDTPATFEISSDPSMACIDFEKVRFPLLIRKWKAGDRFYPFGMKQPKKLSDYFVDRKYSLVEKESKLIIESEGKIVWIIGDRLDNRFRITNSTRNALIIKSSNKAMKIVQLK
jgi:tRNA(Ile)-lysidine synthase